MKTYLKLAILATLAVGVLVGCGKDKDNNNNPNCDQYGYCGGNGYYNPMYPGVPYNPNQVILNGGITITNQNAWQKTVEALTGCSGPFDIEEMCTFINDAYPRLEIYVDDYKMTNGVSNGRIVLGSQTMGAFSFGVGWRAINNNTGFDTQLLLPFEFKGKMFRVLILGKTTDSRVAVELFYGDQSMGTGSLNRINTSAPVPTPYPTPY
jgi:hypothetical protein